MYLYMLLTVLMLVNMLIALMAKSFDNIFEQSEKHYFHVIARSVTIWRRTPAVPPPLNLLSLPYHGYAALRQIAAQPGAAPCLPDPNLDSRRRFGTTAYTTADEVALPSSWLAEHSLGALSRQLTAYLLSNDSQTVREEKWRTELIAKVPWNACHACHA